MVRCQYCGYFPAEANDEDADFGYDPNNRTSEHRIETKGEFNLLVCGACHRVIASR